MPLGFIRKHISARLKHHLRIQLSRLQFRSILLPISPPPRTLYALICGVIVGSRTQSLFPTNKVEYRVHVNPLLVFFSPRCHLRSKMHQIKVHSTVDPKQMKRLQDSPQLWLRKSYVRCLIYYAQNLILYSLKYSYRIQLGRVKYLN